MTDDTSFFLDDLERSRLRRAEELKTMKVRAIDSGKEPFDLERFEAIYNTSERRKQKEGPREIRLNMREYDYYVIFEGVKTIEEYAKELWEVRDKWDGP